MCVACGVAKPIDANEKDSANSVRVHAAVHSTPRPLLSGALLAGLVQIRGTTCMEAMLEAILPVCMRVGHDACYVVLLHACRQKGVGIIRLYVRHPIVSYKHARAPAACSAHSEFACNCSDNTHGVLMALICLLPCMHAARHERIKHATLV